MASTSLVTLLISSPIGRLSKKLSESDCRWSESSVWSAQVASVASLATVRLAKNEVTM